MSRMPRLFRLFALLPVVAVCLFAGERLVAQTDYTRPNPQTEAQIDELLARMTLEEKVGQMTQVTLDVVSRTNAQGQAVEPHALDTAKLREVVVQYNVGSILNVGYHAFTRPQWQNIITGIQQMAGQSRLKVPVLYGIDAIHGMGYADGSTMFPQQLAQAATWNPELVRQAAQITAYETRSCGIPWNFSPVCDLARQPLWSRFFETFGEDPYLASVLSASVIEGYQGNQLASETRVMACLKHYVGYSNPRTGKDRTPAFIPDRYMHELYLPSFQAAVQRGAMSVMVNSGEVNGIPGHVNQYLLTDVLKTQWGFRGFAVTDWEDIIMLHTVHRVAPTMKDAVAMAINAGIDMSMVPYGPQYQEYIKLLIELVRENRVPQARVDDAVRRILRAKISLGLMQNPTPNFANYPNFGSEAHTQAAYTAAQECLTLLKNTNNALPIRANARVLITGPAAHSVNALNGAWTQTWQGTDPNWVPRNKPSILDAFRQRLGQANVQYSPGCTYDSLTTADEAVRMAATADYLIVCVGEAPSTEKPGDINDLALAPAQQELVRRLAATGKPLTLVMVQARPRIISAIEPLAQGILMAYQPGNEGARAIVDVLTGAHNPSGRLPFTYPRHTGDVLFYDHVQSEERSGTSSEMVGYNPQYTFGHGLSYTTFAYSNLQLQRNQVGRNDSVVVSVTVTNTGSRPGQEVVQLYTRDLYASLTPAVRKLRRFTKITLAPGQSQTVRFVLRASDLAFVNAQNQWVTEPGEFDVFINNQTARFTLTQ